MSGGGSSAAFSFFCLVLSEVFVGAAAEAALPWSLFLVAAFLCGCLTSLAPLALAEGAALEPAAKLTPSKSSSVELSLSAPSAWPLRPQNPGRWPHLWSLSGCWQLLTLCGATSPARTVPDLGQLRSCELWTPPGRPQCSPSFSFAALLL